MSNPPSIERIAASLQSFQQMLDPSLRALVQITDVYRVRSQRGSDVHWPRNWEDVWGRKATSGVYLHFDEDDQLLYVGKAVSLAVRLNNYYKYVDYPRDMSCYVNDARLLELGGSGIRVIILEERLKILAPSLEWHLIETLDPPLNKHGRISASDQG